MKQNAMLPSAVDMTCSGIMSTNSVSCQALASSDAIDQSVGVTHNMFIDAGKYPGDDSPVVWGVCGHAFHLQCITKWLSSQTEQRCPFCRRTWEYKSAGPVQMDAEEAS